ncbi:hypothetical protein H311_05069, partial [Anncaliia algerae PRA109]
MRILFLLTFIQRFFLTKRNIEDSSQNILNNCMESINSFIDHLDGTSHSQVKKTKIESMNKFTGENEIINSQTGNFTGMAIASTHKNRDVIGTNDSRERERSLLNFYELIAGDIIKSKNISLKNIKLREYKVRKENPKLFS